MRHHRRAAFVAAAITSVLAIATPAWASCHEAFFSPQNSGVDENDGSVVLTVKNPGDQQRLRTLGYQTLAGTAKPGSDFVAESGTITFSPDATEKTISIAIVNDAVDEGAQRFEVKLKPESGSCIVKLGPDAVVTIDDDDKPKPTPTRDADSDGAKPPPDGSGSGGGDGTGTSTGSGTESLDGSIVDGTPTPSPTPTLTATDATPSAEETRTVIAAVPIDGGGLSGLWIALIVVAAVAAGSVVTGLVRRGSVATAPPPS